MTTLAKMNITIDTMKKLKLSYQESLIHVPDGYLMDDTAQHIDVLSQAISLLMQDRNVMIEGLLHQEQTYNK